VNVAVAVGVGDGDGQASVEMVSSHPPAMVPTAPPLFWSSMTYSDQVPFGSVPLYTERAEPTEGGPGVGPPGAGGAKKSTFPSENDE
jgi:hypothetical protein